MRQRFERPIDRENEERAIEEIERHLDPRLVCYHTPEGATVDIVVHPAGTDPLTNMVAAIEHKQRDFVFRQKNWDVYFELHKLKAIERKYLMRNIPTYFVLTDAKGLRYGTRLGQAWYYDEPVPGRTKQTRDDYDAENLVVQIPYQNFSILWMLCERINRLFADVFAARYGSPSTTRD